MNTQTSLQEIVQPMQRGQITIPIKIRKKLNINSSTWLWVRLVKDKILIEPVKEKEEDTSLNNFLLQDASDEKTYWTNKDDEALKKVESKTDKRLKKVTK